MVLICYYMNIKPNLQAQLTVYSLSAVNLSSLHLTME